MHSNQIKVLSELGTAALAMCGFTASLAEVERSVAATRTARSGDDRAAGDGSSGRDSLRPSWSAG